MKILVASTNPVKIEAVRRVAQDIWPDSEVVGVQTESGVSAQPMSDNETKQGSINRAKNALANYFSPITFDLPNSKKQNEKSKMKGERSQNIVLLSVGLEGGVFENDLGEMWNTVWISVLDEFGNVVSVNGSRFLIPSQVAAGIKLGQEMGDVLEQMTGIKNIKHKEGFIGYMTNNTSTRVDEYSNLVRLAVGLWIGKKYAKSA